MPLQAVHDSPQVKGILFRELHQFMCLGLGLRSRRKRKAWGVSPRAKSPPFKPANAGDSRIAASQLPPKFKLSKRADAHFYGLTIR